MGRASTFRKLHWNLEPFAVGSLIDEEVKKLMRVPGEQLYIFPVEIPWGDEPERD